MQTQTAVLSKKLRTKFVDHLDGFMIAQLITERFHGPFVSLASLEQELDHRIAEKRKLESFLLARYSPFLHL